MPPAIFNRIMALKSTKEIGKFLKGEYERDKRTEGMEVLNLVREFERMLMKGSESIKEYLDKLSEIANEARALGIDLSDNRLVQKFLVLVLERYEATTASLENIKDLSPFQVIVLVVCKHKRIGG